MSRANDEFHQTIQCKLAFKIFNKTDSISNLRVFFFFYINNCVLTVFYCGLLTQCAEWWNKISVFCKTCKHCRSISLITCVWKPHVDSDRTSVKYGTENFFTMIAEKIWWNHQLYLGTPKLAIDVHHLFNINSHMSLSFRSIDLLQLAI